VSKFKRPCLVCGGLGYGSRCDLHQAEANANMQRRKDTPERLAKKRLLYNNEYRQRRKQLLASAIACHLCKKPFVSGDLIEADHLVPGEINSPLAAAHRRCNQSRGDRPLDPYTP
jgi:5-methylcytosine-specific restriction endonuclease McrA